MDKLLHCPFCGNEAMLDVIEPHTHQIATFMPDYQGGTFVECTGCTVTLSEETKEKAIAAWNRRFEPPEETRP